MPYGMKAKTLPPGTDEAVELASTAGEAAALWWAAAFTAEQPLLPTLECAVPTDATLWQRISGLFSTAPASRQPLEAFKAHVAEVVNLLLNSGTNTPVNIQVEYDVVGYPIISLVLDEALTAAGTRNFLDSLFIGNCEVVLPADTAMVVTRDRVVVRYGADALEMTIWTHI